MSFQKQIQTNETEKHVHFAISKPRVSVQVMWFPGQITQGAELVSALQQRAQRHVQQQVQFSFLVWSPSGAGFFFGCHHNPHVGHSPIILLFFFLLLLVFCCCCCLLSFFLLLMADCSHQILMLTSLKAPHESTELISVYSILKKEMINFDTVRVLFCFVFFTFFLTWSDLSFSLLKIAVKKNLFYCLSVWLLVITVWV